MAKTKKKPVPEQNPVEVPLYTPWDVARYLRLPVWAVSASTGRFRGWMGPEFFFERFWRFPQRLPLIDDEFAVPVGEPENQHRISFRRFAELFVRAGVLHTLTALSQVPGNRPERWESVQRSIWRGLEDTSRQPVPFDDSPAMERAEHLAEPFVGGLDEGLSTLLKKHLTIRLDRVEVEAGVPVRLFPLTRDPAEASPRTVVLDPKIRFGRPTITGKGVPTDSLFERYLAGDSSAVLAKDYDLTMGEVEEAIRYESRPPAVPHPFPGW